MIGTKVFWNSVKFTFYILYFEKYIPYIKKNSVHLENYFLKCQSINAYFWKILSHQ